jgi:cystathionine beta-lyase/cystathionine gamma-synthase
MPETEGQPPKIAPEFSSMEHFNAEINDIGYARYNYQELLDREAKFTEMIEGASDTALFNSGAAAMHSTIEAEGLKAGDVVFCANAIYGTSKADIKQLQDLGIKVVFFDSTNMDSLRELVKKEKPRLIVAESVANSKNMEVTDLKSLGQLAEETNSYYQESLTPAKILANFLSKRESLKSLSLETQSLILSSITEYQQGQNPFVFRQAIRQIESETKLLRPDVIRELSRIVQRISQDSREKVSLVIDNTLPSPQLLNPLTALKDFDVEKVIVESGTKHYQEGANEITLGLAYSDNPEKMKAIKARRIELGTYLQPTDERKIPDTISQTMPETMKNHARNALRLAQALGEISGFEVSHPNLPQHKQNELVSSLAPKGAVTLFYITLPERIKGEDFMQKVKDIGGDQVGLGSSFGHAKTWLSNYSMDNRTVRIAAGSENEQDFEQTIAVFKKAASELAGN